MRARSKRLQTLRYGYAAADRDQRDAGSCSKLLRKAACVWQGMGQSNLVSNPRQCCNTLRQLRTCQLELWKRHSVVACRACLNACSLISPTTHSDGFKLRHVTCGVADSATATPAAVCAGVITSRRLLKRQC